MIFWIFPYLYICNVHVVQVKYCVGIWWYEQNNNTVLNIVIVNIGISIPFVLFLTVNQNQSLLNVDFQNKIVIFTLYNIQ